MKPTSIKEVKEKKRVPQRKELFWGCIVILSFGTVVQNT